MKAARQSWQQLANAGAMLYTHKRLGFVLLIPAHLQRAAESGTRPRATDGKSCDLLVHIGGIQLGLDHRRRQIVGRVPPNWLIDLNGDDTEAAPIDNTGDLFANHH